MPSDEPTDPGDAFSEVVARTDPAMIVATLAAGDERSGCLVGFHSQCSIEPPRYAVWISKVNHTFGFVGATTHVAVHLLDGSSEDLATLFGGETGDEVDKFSRCSWTAGPGGVPLLDDCPTRFVGLVVDVTDGGGDHVCVVLEPVDAQVEPFGGDPIVRLADVGDIDPGHPA